MNVAANPHNSCAGLSVFPDWALHLGVSQGHEKLPSHLSCLDLTKYSRVRDTPECLDLTKYSRTLTLSEEILCKAQLYFSWSFSYIPLYCKLLLIKILENLNKQTRK